MKKKWLFLPVLAIVLIFTFLPLNFLRAGSGNMIVNGDFAGNSFSSWSSWGDVAIINESARVMSTTGSNSGIYQVVNTTEKNLIFSFDVTPRYSGSVSNIQIAFTIFKNGVNLGQAFGYFYNLPTIKLAQLSFKVEDFWKQNTGAAYADFDQIQITAEAFSGCSAIFDNFKLESAAPLGTTVEVTKDATAKGEGYLTWTIQKSVNKNLFDLVIGQTADAAYTVTVAPVYHETGITVSGNININNTGSEAASVSYVKDKIEYKIGSGAWTEITTEDISGAFSIPAGDASDVPYSVSFSPVAGATEYQNTALVGIANSASGGGVGFQEYSYTTGFSVSGGNITSDAFADVSDSLQGYLGEAWVGDPATYEYTYTRQIGPYAKEGDYKVGNTATVTGKDTQTTVTASKSVKVHVAGKGTIKVYKDLKAPDGKSKPLSEDKHEFKITLQQSKDSGWEDVETKTIAAGGSQVFDVQTGFEYRVMEAEDRDYVQMENTGPILLEKNAEIKEIRLTGKQKFAVIKVYKDLSTDVSGADTAANHFFWVKLNGGSRTMYQPFNKGFPTYFLVWPGSYTVVEFPEAGYEPGEYQGPVAAKSNGVYILDKGGILDMILDIGPIIAFDSGLAGNPDIYTMDDDGYGQTNITNNPAYEKHPSFSPDSSKIIFTSDNEICTMNIDGSEQTKLTNNSLKDSSIYNANPSFSPDGTRIVFTSNRDRVHKGIDGEIYIMNIDGSGQTRLTNNMEHDMYPSFSPDGTKILFTSYRDGNAEIYIMNADGSGQTNLTNNPGHDEHPFFSPGGARISFTSGRDGNTEIYIMNADGSGQTNLTNNPGHDEHPFFSPDGTKITFASYRNGNWEIYIMNADGSGQTNLTNNPSIDWDPVYSSDGHKIAFKSRRDAPGPDGFYIMNIDGTGQIRLSLPNDSASECYLSFSPKKLTTDLNVPSKYSTVKEAIAAALSNSNPVDYINVAAGSYPENLEINIPAGNIIYLTGATSGGTIIDGKAVSRVIKISGNGIIHIDNITITNGIGWGAGIAVESGSTLFIENCVISGNHSGSHGGGIDNSGTIYAKNCKISGNTASISGGGIYNDGGTLNIEKSLISGNTAPVQSGLAATNTVTAINNWWGSPSGPSGSGPGTGDSISGKVLYSPWLAAAPF